MECETAFLETVAIGRVCVRVNRSLLRLCICGRNCQSFVCIVIVAFNQNFESDQSECVRVFVSRERSFVFIYLLVTDAQHRTRAKRNELIVNNLV